MTIDQLEHFCRQCLAALLVILILLVMLALSGCMTTYEISKATPDGGTVSVTVKSFREFEQPDVSYTRSGEDVQFTFGAESATTAESPIERALGDAIRAGTMTLAPIEDDDQ